MTACIYQRSDKSGGAFSVIVRAPSKRRGKGLPDLPPFHLRPQHRIVLSRPFSPTLPTGFAVFQITELPSLPSGRHTVVSQVFFLIRLRKLTHRVLGVSPEAQGSCEHPEKTLRSLARQHRWCSSAAAELSAASKVLQVCDDVAKQSVSGVDSWLRGHDESVIAICCSTQGVCLSDIFLSLTEVF